MQYIIATILGIIEGLTEFLPVSSTGHLILFNDLFNFQGEFANLFAIVIQTGAILAAIIYFRKTIMPKKLGGDYEFKTWLSLWMKVLVAMIPAAIIGILFESIIEEKLFHSNVVAIALILGALLLIFVENNKPPEKYKTIYQITVKSALIVGIAQCMALIPGMSRSASTIIGALWIGFDRKLAAEFSFFLAIPTIIGAGFIKLRSYDYVLTSKEISLLVVGTLVSFIVAYIVIAIFMNYIRKNSFKIFAYYRIILGVIIALIWFISKGYLF